MPLSPTDTGVSRRQRLDNCHSQESQRQTNLQSRTGSPLARPPGEVAEALGFPFHIRVAPTVARVVYLRHYCSVVHHLSCVLRLATTVRASADVGAYVVQTTFYNKPLSKSKGNHGNLNSALQELRAEREQAQLHVDKIDQAISVIESLNGSGSSGQANQPTRIVSAASRRKMAQAQKARWARAREESQPAAADIKTHWLGSRETQHVCGRSQENRGVPACEMGTG
jgi:hypothetical protein